MRWGLGAAGGKPVAFGGTSVGVSEASAVFTYPTFPDSSWDNTEIPPRKRRSSLVPQTVLADYPPPPSS